MQVIDHQPAAWFFLQDGSDYFLDVCCGRSAVGFSVTIQLSEEERALYASLGHAYIEKLADQIFNKSNPLDPRHIRDSAIQERLHSAIMEWQKTH